MARTNDLLAAALAYAVRGWNVFPVYEPVGSGCSCSKGDQCEHPGKHPRTENGFWDATVDETTIKEWWTVWASANIGARTGEASGLVVLDVDVGPAKTGDVSLAELEKEHGALPVTVESITGGGGRQLFFTHPGHPVKSVSGALGKNLDLKADGGYVVVPPSLHVSGRRYKWKPGCGPEACDLAPLPAWIPGLLVTPTASGRGGGPLDPAEILAGVPDGKRDETLFRYACRLCAQGLDRTEAEVLLTAAADRAKPPFPVAGVLAKVEAVWRKYSAGTSRASNRGSSATKKLVKIAMRKELFHDARKDTYAVSEESGVRRIISIGGREFKRDLVREYHDETGNAPGSDAVATAIGLADARAAHDGPTYPLEVRFAVVSEEEVWIDLVDEEWRAIKVTSDGWEIVDRPPILFRRFSHQKPLPQPVKGGDPFLLFELLNLSREEDRILALPWLTVLPIVNVPRPGLMLHGVKGSAKSYTARVLRDCLDPSINLGLDVPRDVFELGQFLDHTAVPWLDNISKLRDWQADRLCAAITGGGLTKRQLYTDAEDVLMTFRRTIVLTGINVPTAAPDLLERLILIELSPPEKRLQEATLSKRFDELHPRILGGLLDTLSGAMRARPGVVLAEPPRMADFAHWAAAAAEELGYGADDFEKIYRTSFERQAEEVLSDVLAVAIREFAAAKGEWRGSASELLAELNNQREAAGRQKDADWPKRAAELGKRLKVLMPTLREQGLTIEISPSHKYGREITIIDPAALATGTTETERK